MLGKMRAHFVFLIYLFSEKSNLHFYVSEEIKKYRKCFYWPRSNRNLFKKHNYDIYQNSKHIFITLIIFVFPEKIITHQPWLTELAVHTHLVNKTVRYWATPIIIRTQLKTLLIVMIGLFKTFMSQVKNTKCRFIF